MAARTRSRATPKYKAKYRVGHWAAYDAALRARGDLTVWFDEAAIAAWNAPPSGRPGGQRRSWRALHLGVDADGFVIASALTDSGADDAGVGVSLLEQVEGAVARFTADRAYDSRGLVRPEGAERRP